MTNTAAVAAELEILTAALDEPGADVAQSLRELALVAAAAIGSYLGLSVHVAGSDPPFAFTALADAIVASDIRASLQVVMASTGENQNQMAVVVHLFAGSPGAFVDLAADLAWLTGRPPKDFALDEHLRIPAPDESRISLRASSVINQAVGVLIARGYSPRRADWQLDVQAAHAGTDRHTAAQVILARLATADSESVDKDLGGP